MPRSSKSPEVRQRRRVDTPPGDAFVPLLPGGADDAQGKWRIVDPHGRSYVFDPDTTIAEVTNRLLSLSRATGRTQAFEFRAGPSGSLSVRLREGEGMPPARPDTCGEAGTIPSRTIEEALGRALERGRALVARTLDEDDMLSGEELAERLEVSRETVNVWRKRRRLLALEGAKRGYRYPAWQIGADARPWPALPRLFSILGDDPWAVHRFLVQPHGALGGRTGRAALDGGRDADALRAAESMAAGDFA